MRDADESCRHSPAMNNAATHLPKMFMSSCPEHVDYVSAKRDFAGGSKLKILRWRAHPWDPHERWQEGQNRKERQEKQRLAGCNVSRGPGPRDAGRLLRTGKARGWVLP